MDQDVIYIERSKAENIKTENLQPGREYYPCERIEDNGVYISEYDYYMEIDGENMFAYIEESVTPKHWDHKYISPRLYMKSIEMAIKKSSKVSRFVSSDFDTDILRVSYYVALPKEEKVIDNILGFDRVIDSIRNEAIIISKRELLRYINE